LLILKKLDAKIIKTMQGKALALGSNSEIRVKKDCIVLRLRVMRFLRLHADSQYKINPVFGPVSEQFNTGKLQVLRISFGNL